MCTKVLILACLLITSDYLPLEDDVFILTRSKTSRHQLLGLFLCSMFTHFIGIHLVADLLVEAFLFMLAAIFLVVSLVHIDVNAIVMLFEHSFIELLLTSDLVLVSSKCILLSLFLHRIGVLDDSRVKLRLDVATVMKSLHDRWRCLCQARASNA